MRPFLVLISDRSDAATHKDQFRRDTGLLAGTFAFLNKDDAQNAEHFYFQMATWGLGHPVHTHIQAFAEAAIGAITETAQMFKARLSELTVQDYSFIQRICLEEDGQPLGEYNGLTTIERGKSGGRRAGRTAG